MNVAKQPTMYEKWKAYIKNYKTLMLSILIFIVLDLSILIFNFYISYKIANNAAVINVAAELEVLSQKISKNLLVFERAYNKSIPYDDILVEIEKSIGTFDRSLTAFDQGGQLVLNDGALLDVEAIDEPMGREAIVKAKPMWLIYKNYTNSVLEEFRFATDDEETLTTIFSREYLIKSVVGYTARNNANLLLVLENLTDSLEFSATQKTRQLRVIQLFGIFLAVINFFYIMLYALRKLQSKDQALLDAKTEIEVMLNAITEGVVLIDSSLVIREHHSTEMEKIFSRTDFVGQSIVNILNDANCDEDGQIVETYLRQWFDISHEVEALTKSNPIAQIQIYNTGDTLYHTGKKYLTTSFSRVHHKIGGVAFLLVRFKDSTEHGDQFGAIESDFTVQQKQLDIMAALINCDIQKLPSFFHLGFQTLERMQQLLARSNNDLTSSGETLLQLLQPFKNECSSYNFISLMQDVQAVESSIKSALLNAAELKTQEKHHHSIEKLASELESVYYIVNHLVGNQWSNKSDNAIAL